MKVSKKTLSIVPFLFTIYRFLAHIKSSPIFFDQTIYFLVKTEVKLSTVITSDVVLNSHEQEKTWSCLTILDSLANQVISIYEIFTLNTDLILKKKNDLHYVISPLETNDYKIIQ